MSTDDVQAMVRADADRFRVVCITIWRGVRFDRSDGADAEPGVIITERMVRAICRAHVCRSFRALQGLC
ncbi:MAG TPA: hypothetical protein VGA22_14165 [Gemmatimonadales bacterium]|jgi:hypothetical protein